MRMKKIFILIVSLFTCFGVYAQEFNIPQGTDSYPLCEIKNDGNEIEEILKGF